MTGAFTTYLNADQRKRIPVAKLGKYKDPRYGEFAITASMVASWKRLLASHFGGRVAVDYDHNTDKAGPTGSEAAAWITNLDVDSTGQVWGDVEWTPDGQKAVEEKRYLFVSPTFGEAKDEQGKPLGPALLRAALTNNPFLRSMPAITLEGPALLEDGALPKGAFEELRRALSEDLGRRVSEHADSRASMTPLAPIAKALGLDDTATEAVILETVAELQKPPAREDTRTLDAMAAEQGKVVLDSADVAKLKLDAQAGRQAADTLKEQRFTLAYDKALEKGSVDTSEDTRKEWRELYDAAPDLTVKRLDALAPIVNLAAGETKHRTQTASGAPDGVDPDAYMLDQKAHAWMAEHDTDDYMAALDAVTKGA
jgi:phage I-like protein